MATVELPRPIQRHPFYCVGCGLGQAQDRGDGTWKKGDTPLGWDGVTTVDVHEGDDVHAVHAATCAALKAPAAAPGEVAAALAGLTPVELAQLVEAIKLGGQLAAGRK